MIEMISFFQKYYFPTYSSFSKSYSKIQKASEVSFMVLMENHAWNLCILCLKLLFPFLYCYQNQIQIKMSTIQAESTKPIQIDYSHPENRAIALDFQLKMLLIYGPQLGIYVLPHLNHPNLWQGIILVRHGYYKQGKFRFSIDLAEFPQKQPQIFFKTKMYHPLVDYKTGELDVAATLPEPWNYYSDTLLHNLFNEFKLIFTDLQKLANKNSFNSQAGVLHQQNVYDFLVKAKDSVQSSIDSLNEYQQGSALNTNEIQEQQRQKLIQKLLQAKQLPLKGQDKIQYFIRSLMS